jgi:hypothetical protein
VVDVSGTERGNSKTRTKKVEIINKKYRGINVSRVTNREGDLLADCNSILSR